MTDQEASKGLQCPRCGCRDLLDASGRPWPVTHTITMLRSIRRYRICRHCGAKVRTKETIEKSM